VYAIVIFLSIVASLTVFTRNMRGVAAYGLLAFYMIIDYSNYLFRLGDTATGTLAKSFKEMLLITLVLAIGASAASRRTIDRKVVVMIGATLLLLLYGSIMNGFLLASLDWRGSILPIILAILLVNAGLLDERRVGRLMSFLAIAIAANSAFAVLQYYTFSGDFESTWRYDFLLQEALRADSDFESRLMEYQIVRDGNLRSSGVFASALQFSYSAALACFYFYCRSSDLIRRGRLLSSVGWGALMILCAWGVYVSQVRASLIIVLVSIALHVICFSARDGGRFKAGIAISIGVGAVVVFAWALMFHASAFDASVQGRIPQYAFLVQNFIAAGHGVGSFRSKFDSYYIYGFLTFGIIFAAWLIYVLRVFWRSFGGRMAKWKPPGDTMLRGFMFSSVIPMLVICSFQHVSGSLYYQVIWMLLFAGSRMSMRIGRASTAESDCPPRAMAGVASARSGA